MARADFIVFLRSIWRILVDRPSTPPSLVDNELLHVVLNRRSVRKFSEVDIPEDVMDAILEAGRLAPSTVNLQTWTFAHLNASRWQEKFNRPIPFRGKQAVIIMGDTYRDRMVLDAFPESPLVEYSIGVMNASLAAMNMNIAAEVLGVSSVMLSETGRSGLLDMGYLKEMLGLPERVFPIMTMIFGYPRGVKPPMPPKLPLEQICFQDVYPYADLEIMQDWLAQMKVGYKASKPLSSFDAQLKIYQGKLSQAEQNLRDMIFGDQ